MDQTTLLTHKCGLCNGIFKTEEEYVAHKCNVTGFMPVDIEHQGEEFKAISAGALLRGNLKKQLVGAGYLPERADLISGSVVSQEEADAIIHSFITNKQSNA